MTDLCGSDERSAADARRVGAYLDKVDAALIDVERIAVPPDATDIVEVRLRAALVVRIIEDLHEH